jgi:hypothetical protein
MGAVAADVEIPSAVRAGIAKADPLARAELHDRIAREAAHAASLHEPEGLCKRRAVQFRGLSADTAGVQDSERPLPIYSKLIDDPNSGDAIDDFVVCVAERVDHLQDADSRGDFAELGKLACELALDARDAGFDLLAEVARAVEAACADQSKKPAHDGVVAVTDLAYRIRRGHRGAMS